MKKTLIIITGIFVSLISCKKEVTEQNIYINKNKEKFKIEYSCNILFEYNYIDYNLSINTN